MKEIITKVYEFDELDEKGKEKAREWYRDASSDDTIWSECVIDDAKTILALMGWDIDKIYYSGFNSQGDGACFTGTWRADNVKVGKAKEYAPTDEELHKIAKIYEELAEKHPVTSMSVKHSGRYCHENCTEFDAFDGGFYELEMGNDEMVKNEESKNIFIETSKDAMRWIYKNLEREWDFQNSDETIDENIKANFYTFTESGKRFG
jgi:hypothetical protein